MGQTERRQMDKTERIIPLHGGYRKLRSFRRRGAVYDATVILQAVY